MKDNLREIQLLAHPVALPVFPDALYSGAAALLAQAGVLGGVLWTLNQMQQHGNASRLRIDSVCLCAAALMAGMLYTLTAALFKHRWRIEAKEHTLQENPPFSNAALYYEHLCLLYEYDIETPFSGEKKALMPLFHNRAVLMVQNVEEVDGWTLWLENKTMHPEHRLAGYPLTCSLKNRLRFMIVRSSWGKSMALIYALLQMLGVLVFALSDLAGFEFALCSVLLQGLCCAGLVLHYCCREQVLKDIAGGLLAEEMEVQAALILCIGAVYDPLWLQIRDSAFETMLANREQQTGARLDENQCYRIWALGYDIPGYTSPDPRPDPSYGGDGDDTWM